MNHLMCAIRESRPCYITRSRCPEQGTTFQPLVFTNRSLRLTPLKYYSRDILDCQGPSLAHTCMWACLWTSLGPGPAGNPQALQLLIPRRKQRADHPRRIRLGGGFWLSSTSGSSQSSLGVHQNHHKPVLPK
uniref:Uncharacterized protein n=1 Tax=Triticum urartu TaxID=4572 RepID=A0A8R7U386_TRIUA